MTGLAACSQNDLSRSLNTCGSVCAPANVLLTSGQLLKRYPASQRTPSASGEFKRLLLRLQNGIVPTNARDFECAQDMAAVSFRFRLLSLSGSIR